MPTSKTTALVLKKTKLGETDLIITLLDEEGLQRRAVAKGARKPGSFLAAPLELYQLVEVQLSSGRSLEIVTDARVLDTHANCRSDIEHSAAAAAVVELAEKATSQSNPEPLLFAMTEAALKNLEEASGSAIYLISLACLLKLCAALGVHPDAREIAAGNTLLADWVDLLLGARFADLQEYQGPEYQPLLIDLREFTQRWIERHLEIKLKSLGFIESLLVT